MALRKPLSPADAAAPTAPLDAATARLWLDDPDPDRRCEAAHHLAGQPGHCDALGRRLKIEPLERVQQALFTALTRLATPASAGVLLPLLRSESAPLRNGAIEALASMPAATGAHVGPLLHDADPDVRIFTVNLLGDLRHPQVTPWLLDVLQQDTAVNVVAAAVEVMAEIGQPEHVEALRAAAARFATDPFMAFAIGMAIERIEAA